MHSPDSILSENECPSMPCVHDVYYVCCQDALSVEINNLGISYGKELVEKPPLTSTEQKNHSNHTSVDREQFLRWEELRSATNYYFLLMIKLLRIFLII